MALYKIVFIATESESLNQEIQHRVNIGPLHS